MRKLLLVLMCTPLLMGGSTRVMVLQPQAEAVACTPPEYHFEETWETNPGSDETWTEACATTDNCNEDWDSGDAPPSPLHGSES